MSDLNELLGDTAGIPGSEQGVDNGAIFDLGGVSTDNAFGFPVLEPGNYHCVCTSVKWGQSQNSAAWMITWQFTVMSGPGVGTTITDWTILKDKEGKNDPRGLAKLKRYIMILAPDYPLTGFNPSVFAAQGVVIHREIMLKLGKQKDNQNVGQFRNNIADISAVPPKDGADALAPF